MPSETHKALYQRLADTTGRITTALDEEDATTLMDIAASHSAVMNQLRQAGLSQDAGLLKQVEDIGEQVRVALAKMMKRRDELCRQLVMFDKQKKVSAAYGGNKIPFGSKKPFQDMSNRQGKRRTLTC